LVGQGDVGPDSDLDVLVDTGGRRSLFEQAALQNDLEGLLGSRVQVTTADGPTYARGDTRERIEREAVSLCCRGET